MSFKEFSTTHNAPIKGKRTSESNPAPLVDQPPAPPGKLPAESKPSDKS